MSDIGSSVNVNPDGVKVSGDPEILSKTIKALRNVYDPEIPVNIYDLGLIYEIHVTKDAEGKPSIKVVMTITAVGCPVVAIIAAYAEEAIREHVPEARDVVVDIVYDPPWTPDRITKQGREHLKAIYGYDIVEEWKKRLTRPY